MARSLPRPFLKWAGGKGQLLDRISDSLPIEFDSYLEPFVGGGAVFFHIYRNGFRRHATLSDINLELMTAYETVRDSVEELIDELQSGVYEDDKEVYYSIRKWDREPDWEEVSSVRRTARMIYLNRTCYNGLYRVNQKGQFNVPYGRYENPTICDEENLRAVSKALQGVDLLCTDFEEAVERASKGDLIYLDPPYQPVSDTANFTSYTKGGFDESEQRRLAKVFKELNDRGCLVLESNSSAALIQKLYENQNFVIEKLQAKRAISSDPNGRGNVTELLIRNYKSTKQQRLV